MPPTSTQVAKCYRRPCGRGTQLATHPQIPGNFTAAAHDLRTWHPYIVVTLALKLALLLASAAQASPWLEPGDIRARHSVQWLADRGCLNIPANTWPIMWADLSRALNHDAPDHCRDSLAWRYLRFERDYHMTDQPRISLRAAGASREPWLRDFDDAPREKAEIGARLEMKTDHLAFGLAPTYVRDPRDGDRLRFDGSYLAGTAGNWVLGAGAIDRWWGPGWHSAALLSSNSRPVPGVWLNRRRSDAPEWIGLRWLGPWNFVAFAGQLESDRFISEAKLIGARFSFRPWQHLEIGLMRTFLWGGEGQSESWSSLRNCTLGQSNVYGDTENPCDQIAGGDFRLSLPVGDNTVGFYGEVIGEDEAGFLPSQLFGTFGVDAASRLAGGEQRFFVEFTDTVAGVFSSEERLSAYEHSTFRTGNRYKGRTTGSTWESNSRVVSLGANQFFRNGSDISVTYSRAELNRVDTLRSRPPEAGVPVFDVSFAQDVDIYALRYRRPVLGGRLTLSGYHTSKEIETEARIWSRTTAMAAWEFRFD